MARLEESGQQAPVTAAAAAGFDRRAATV